MIATRSYRPRMVARFVTALLVVSPLSATAIAQVPAVTFASDLPRGRVVDTVRSLADTSQRFAVFLPSRYRIDTRWPLLFLMDPRGRALVPLELFRDAAERYGYVVVSSYNTQSDGPRETNDRALAALLSDVPRALAIDTRRIYLTGFSGTTRFAWDVSEQFPGTLAGIIGVGAGLPGDLNWLAAHVRGAPFAYFGSVGVRDPNYEELRELDDALARTSLPHALSFFDGGHAWPPSAICERAIEWMELQAMRRRLRDVNRVWVDSMAAVRRSEAASNEIAGRSYEAWTQFAALASDFDSLVTVADDRGRAERLSRDPRVVRTRERMTRNAARDRAFGIRLFEVLHDLRESSPPLAVGEVRRQLSLDNLRKESQSDDTLAALAAKRMLARVLMHAGFYEPRAYLAQHDFARAEAILRVAAWIAPDDGGVCLGLARALAQRGGRALDEAVKQLDCAIGRGAPGVRLLESDSLLVPLHARPEWSALLERARLAQSSAH